VEGKLNREKREKERKTRKELRAKIAEGCHEMWYVMLETEREWHPLEEEVERRYAERG
jgi:hypothetical protein